MASTPTNFPVVLIHGVFGYGRTRPLWNLWSPYWPEEALNTMNQNHLMVDVGALSSDHDRACEAFYQLYGGQVDYGEDHSREAGHNRFGATFGATTALELYQLICAGFFGVGSNHRWVMSLVSVAGPLTGSTITHLFGLHDLQMVPYSLGHFIGAALGVWFKLHTDWPILRQIFDFKMPQWQCVNTFREILSPYGRISSTDLAVFNLLPRERMTRNAELIHMDKIFLVSVATSTPLDYASIPSLYALLLVMRRHVATLHVIFDGFDRTLWGDNDGAVNLYSMLQPWASVMPDGDSESTTSTSSSLSQEADVTTASKKVSADLYRDELNELNPSDPTDHLAFATLRRGVWYVHRVERNHMAVTHFDKYSPELFQRLFRVMANQIETSTLAE
ncbi:uncharacterized protein PITG_21184 [Phytophthora infestans T30-4]|uniref:Lipase-like C-terminal domain-containing protein n=1 Tax=Phytophthora infestans (strain T30-4) TaxID=403677 RepID=D0P396_PHYIT|nr:uncharacterized protein PITG_21184 [Phytophthora infestans T30-4]EEY59278.1 conserved hypothetical protein [Phytophthora infestans T30-4]|eukprot:XP_002895226.1 conserved hypothetical protein [Phytophthora infestans T30-4]